MALKKVESMHLKYSTVLLMVAVIFLGLVIGVLSAQAYYDPNSNVAQGWSGGTGTTYAEIDDGIRQPNTPGTGDYLSSKSNSGDGVSEFGFPTVSETPTHMTLWVYTGTGGDAEYTFYLQQGGTTRCSQYIAPGTADGWQSCNWTNPSGDYSAMTIELGGTNKNGMGPPQFAYVYSAYLEVGYQPAIAPTVYINMTNQSNVSDSTPTINITITDPENTTTAATLYFNGTNVSYNGTVQNNTLTNMIVSPAQSDGLYWYWVEADDGTDANTSLNYTIRIDTSKPTVTNPNTNNSNNVVQNSEPLNITVNATDTGSGVTAVSVNGTSMTRDGTNTDIWYTLNTSSDFGCNTDGSCLLTFNATDGAGNFNDTTALTLTIDDTAPSILNGTTNDSDSKVRSADPLNFTVNATDANGIVSVSLNGTGMTQNSGQTDLWYYESTAGSFGCSESSCLLTFIATDNASNTNSTDLTLTIDDTAPVVLNLTPFLPTQYELNDLINITSNVTDSGVGLDTVLANVTSANSSWELLTLTDGNSDDIFNGTYINTTAVGVYNIRILANDTVGNLNNSETSSFNITSNPPNLTSINASPDPIKGGNTITITAEGEDDVNSDTLYFYCRNDTTPPTSSNTICTGGDQADLPPYDLSCTFSTPTDTSSHNAYCRVYDESVYSPTRNTTYTTDSTPPSTTINNVAGDTTATYYDTVDDGVTNITIDGESEMACRWSTSDVSYSSMSNDCTIIGTQAICSATTLTQGTPDFYVSCQDSLGNGQNSSENNDITALVVDWTAPNTTDNSTAGIHVPPYYVKITENDNLDGDPLTHYCTDTTGICTPTTVIDDGGVITFNSSNRSQNYLRYNSTDFVGNVQSTTNVSIQINQLPVFSSAGDNVSGIIQGGTLINISTNSSDADAGQTLKLFVCNSSNISYVGCADTEYCNDTVSSENSSCTFNAEIDTDNHTWYAFIYDSLNESAVSNHSGTYETDSTGPVITITSPLNTTYSLFDILLDVSTSEPADLVWYNLTGQSNETGNLSNTSSTEWNKTLTLSNGNYNISFYANDSYGNNATPKKANFTVYVEGDVTPPVITINSPENKTYQRDWVMANISTDENTTNAVYVLDGGSKVNMTQASLTSWYKNITSISEGSHNISFYVNDTSNNTGNNSISFTTDALPPNSTLYNATPNPANESQDVLCYARWRDAVKLDYGYVSENATSGDGTFTNHTVVMAGTEDWTNYTVSSPAVGSYACRFWAKDDIGNWNQTKFIDFTVQDVTAPSITINSPLETTYLSSSVLADIDTTEAADSAWYNLTGPVNKTDNLTNTSPTHWNTTITGLINGDYTVIFYANDSSNNIGNASRNFTVSGVGDTSPPSITIVSPSNTSYARNWVWGNITTGEDAVNASYLLDGGSEVYLTNSTPQYWYKNISSIPDGQHNIVFYANDSAGNTGNNSVSFLTDVTAPSYMQYNATPNPASEGQSVNCYSEWNDSVELDVGYVSENATSGDGSFTNHTVILTGTHDWANFTISKSSLSVGTYACKFYAKDKRGNTNKTGLINITVQDVTAPVITVLSPDNITYNNTTSVSAEVSLDEKVAWVGYSLDGNANETLNNITGDYWSKSVSITEGQHDMIFYANDSSGNNATPKSVSFYVNNSVPDTTPPSIAVYSPTNGTYYSTSSVLLNITTSENASNAAYSLNGTAREDLGSYNETIWNKTLTLGDSYYNVTFYANDTSNNEGDTTDNVIYFYVDTTPPTPSNTGAIPNPANESQNVECYSKWTDLALSSGSVSENSSGSFENHSVSISGSNNWTNYTIPSSDLSKGSYTCRFYATDEAGWTNSTETNFTVQDVVSPSITINSPLNTTYSSSEVLASITTSEAADSAWYSFDDGLNNTTMDNTSSTNWNYTLNLSDGWYNITFWANDSSGNIGGPKDASFNISTTAEDTLPPTITIYSPANGTYYDIGIVLLNITTSENATWAGYSLNNGPIQNLSNESPRLWNKTLNITAEGYHNVTFYANDSAGNQGNTTNNVVEFYVDTNPPAYSLVNATPNPANQSQNVKCQAYWTDLALSSGSVSENSSGSFVNHSISLSGPSAWANYTIPGSDLSLGKTTCRFYATDKAGRTANTETNFTVQDVTAPSITINSPLDTTYTSSTVLASITTNENVTWAGFSLDGAANVTMGNTSPKNWNYTLTNLSNSDHTIIFYANDSSGNTGSKNKNFTVNVAAADTTFLGMSVSSPIENKYYNTTQIWFNITELENFGWAGYSLDGAANTTLANSGNIWYNNTVVSEASHWVIFYANDSAGNEGNSSNITFYADITKPNSTNHGADPSITNNSGSTICYTIWNDNIELSHAYIEHNASGTYSNSSRINLTGTSDWANLTINSSSLTPGSFNCRSYAYDMTGHKNKTDQWMVTVTDVTPPSAENISYLPTSAADLDPGVNISVWLDVTDNSVVGQVTLQYRNGTGSWNERSMSNVGTNYSSWFNATTPGNWSFRINATDTSSNENITDSVNLTVENEYSWINETNEFPIVTSLTLSQRSSSTGLGNLIINNTGDYDINLTLSSGWSRVTLNGTGNTSLDATVAHSGNIINLTVEANTTDLSAGLYDYLITTTATTSGAVPISESINRTINVQNEAGPYLSVSITDYDATPTEGGENIQYVATLKNLGTDDASSTWFAWALPSDWTITSGIENRSIGILPIGVDVTNTIKATIGSSGNKTITASADCSESSCTLTSDSKTVAISALEEQAAGETIIEGGGGTPGGAGGGGGTATPGLITEYETFDVVRGEGVNYPFSLENVFSNAQLKNIKVELSGYLAQYIRTVYDKKAILSPGNKLDLYLDIRAPSYMNRSEHEVILNIKGELVGDSGKRTFGEERRVKLIVHEVSKETASNTLETAFSALDEMDEKGFNTLNLEGQLANAKNNLENGYWGRANSISNEVLSTKKTAFKADSKIEEVESKLEFARERRLGAPETRRLLDLAQAALLRGDYNSALERAEEAGTYLRLEVGNKISIIWFISEHWWKLVLAGIGLAAVGIFVYQKEAEVIRENRLENLSDEEMQLIKNIEKLQEAYFVKKLMSKDTYYAAMAENQKRIREIRKERIRLRTKPFGISTIDQKLEGLDKEFKTIMKQIKELQLKRYKEKKISKEVYENRIETYHAHLADVEKERLTLELERKLKEEKKGWFAK